MLRTRVITARALMALLLPSLFWLPQSAWALLVALFIGIAGWEWGGLLGWKALARIVLGVLTALVCAALSLADPAAIGAAGFEPGQPWVQVFYGCAVLFWGLLVPFWLRGKWQLGGIAGLLVGAVVLLPAWLAAVQLRALGPGVLIAVFAVVWAADTAAYFAGRRFGRNKLAPAISPGKTREGAYGAAVGVLCYGLLVGHFFFATLMPLPLWIVVLLALTALSIIGDLFESLLKRNAGIKDSSNVLPGHGGVLDRIDSLTSTLPVVAVLWLFFLRDA
ncbi:MAG: phosphatidate cytidylyltransferase [Azonexus sp.]|jgi:phosphatidate cytidylyltransferase|uniref:phosphatidate cytidylyltransferase n=1 Tax=Azonexus sp. TaxID=1872668 RepID=UPI002837CF3B|nr:phosphatidate cytidylyltransferase [Azonexus sp.]MDR0775165.1 phosphatidate cytidylyltransferase [Azonexus sp.]